MKFYRFSMKVQYLPQNLWGIPAQALPNHNMYEQKAEPSAKVPSLEN